MRYCLRRALKLQEILEICKAALVDVASEELAAKGERSTTNRLSMMTGIHRADVARLTGDASPPRKPASNIVNRLIAQWQTNKRFLTKAGKPRLLSFDGKEGEFAELVKTVSSDPNPYSLLIELQRIRAVEHTQRGVRLKLPEYIIRLDPKQSFEHLSHDSDDLIVAVEENVFTARSEPNLHLRTEYDRVPREYLPVIRRWILDQGSAFHARVREFLANYDVDSNRRLRASSPTTRITVCSFSRSEENSGNLQGDDKDV